MREARTTAEIKCEELASLIATSSRVDRITARMPAITLQRLRTITMPIALEAPVVAPVGGGTTLPSSSFLDVPRHRIAVIATSALVTMMAVLGLATVF